MIQELDSALEATAQTEKREKRKADDTDAKSSAPKKIVLNRNPSVSSETQNGNTAIETATQDNSNGTAEKKVIKLSELSAKERLEMRAKKFGVELSSTAKKAARSERFGLSTNTTTGGITSSVDVLQKRAERFGTKVSPVLSKLDQEERLEKRKARFGSENGANVSQSEKAKQRLERFK